MYIYCSCTRRMGPNQYPTIRVYAVIYAFLLFHINEKIIKYITLNNRCYPDVTKEDILASSSN